MTELLFMSNLFIADFQPGQQIEDKVFLVKQKDLRTTTNGSLYIHAVLMDKTAQIPARMWQATQKIYEFIPTGGFMRFTGRCENYKGNPQFIITGLGEADPASVDPSDFLPCTDRNIDEMFTRLRAILTTEIKNADVKRLVDAFLDDEALMRRFRRAPAAVQLHHAYLGGLLQHTLSLLEIALRVIPLYPKLNLDLVLAGLFLHDIGKTAELGYETSFHYTDQGQLLGHVTLATIWIDEKARHVEAQTGEAFPEGVKWAVQHIVVSHHGRYEFGAPKLPASPEAMAVHYLDNLDAKVNLLLEQIAGDRDPESHWTRYNPGIETKVFKMDMLGNQIDSGV